MEDARTSFAEQYIRRLKGVLDEVEWSSLSPILGLLEEARAADRQVFIAGNGGSAATASHMACDLMLTVPKAGTRAFRAIALTDNVASLTAVGNDESYEQVFVAQMRSLANPSDVLIVITGSGRSANVVAAARFARERDMKVIGLLGMDGGTVAPLCDFVVIVPTNDYGPIEDAHMILDHLITDYFRQ